MIERVTTVTCSEASFKAFLPEWNAEKRLKAAVSAAFDEIKTSLRAPPKHLCFERLADVDGALPEKIEEAFRISVIDVQEKQSYTFKPKVPKAGEEFLAFGAGGAQIAPYLTLLENGDVACDLPHYIVGRAKSMAVKRPRAPAPSSAASGAAFGSGASPATATAGAPVEAAPPPPPVTASGGAHSDVSPPLLPAKASHTGGDAADAAMEAAPSSGAGQSSTDADGAGEPGDCRPM